jgi:hypothetical protein
MTIFKLMGNLRLNGHCPRLSDAGVFGLFAADRACVYAKLS